MPYNNALHNAARDGHLAEVEAQVRNFDINAKGNKNKSALIQASENGHTEVVKLLLTYNPKVNMTSDYDLSALNRAAFEGHTEIVKALLKVDDIKVNHASFIGDTSLIMAAMRGHVEIVKELLKVYGINIHLANRPPPHNEGKTAIHYAATSYAANASKIVKLLTDFVPPTRPVVVPPPTPVVSLRSILKPALPPSRPSRSYVGPAIMSYRKTSSSVLASGRTVAAHAASVPMEERAAQELSLVLDGLCKSGQFADLSAVTRVLAKPTGQSVVFEGVYQGQQVAVKVFRDKTTKVTAANEVAYLRRCAHRHVLGALNTYEFNERALLVMPLAREDLQAVIEKAEGPLPHDQVTRYVQQMATALAFLHDEKRVAHLDLKAGNVFIAKSDGRTLLADFGMAMDITDINRDQLLDCGTPMFQASELWAQRLGDPVQRGNRAKVDVYAFGCMVWQLLTRQLPFQREIENDGWLNNDFLLLATAVRRERRSPADMLETRWPEPLRRVIQTCCAYEPERRPTMAQLLREYLR